MELSAFNESYVQRLIAGDPDTERHFTAYFGALLLLKLRRHIRAPQDLADIRQETFVRVLGALRRDGGLERPERLGAFVCSVCENVRMEHGRARRQFDPDCKAVPEPADERAPLDQELISRERKLQVEHVLGELALKDRELLRLIFLEEWDKRDICRRFHATPEYLRVLLHRAKSRFREKYLESVKRI